jgi:hypothetical protein
MVVGSRASSLALSLDQLPTLANTGRSQNYPSPPPLTPKQLTIMGPARVIPRRQAGYKTWALHLPRFRRHAL